jgi:hypothetical protein
MDEVVSKQVDTTISFGTNWTSFRTMGDNQRKAKSTVLGLGASPKQLSKLAINIWCRP